jgi:pyruvate/2-oxoacid:ferredoxin oxidoreductase alpha subunit
MGHKEGLFKMRVCRPFPTEDLRTALDRGSKSVAFDRNLSLGREGIFCSGFKAALVHGPVRHRIQGYLAGIGAPTWTLM